MQAQGSNRESSNNWQRIVLVVPGRLPLWNAILGMHHWARKKFKDDQMNAFASALLATASASQMKTGCAKNIWSIAADTLALYRKTRLMYAQSRQAKKRLLKASQKEPK